MPKFTSGTVVGDSRILDNGSRIYYGSTATTSQLTTSDHIFGLGSNLNLVINNSSNPAIATLRSVTDTGVESSITVQGDTVWLNAYNEVLYYCSSFGLAQHRFVIGTLDPVFLITATAATSAVNITAPALIKSGATSSDVLYGNGSTKKITSGTAAPSGGSDGDIYLQYV
jgi:hypothetical protein